METKCVYLYQYKTFSRSVQIVNAVCVDGENCIMRESPGVAFALFLRANRKK